jgi:hypothetical protein
MCVVCSAATVGRRLPLKRVLRHRFNHGPYFGAVLITTFATISNPEALFCRALLGNKHGVIMSWLDQLRRTT